MSKCYQLIGVPASGKSTWIKDQVWMLGLPVVSTDAFVEDYARAQGKTYSEVFVDYMPTAIDLMIEQVVFAREHSHTIIWDQTSTTVKSRARKFNMLPDYEHIAVVFRTPEHYAAFNEPSGQRNSGSCSCQHDCQLGRSN